MYVSEDGTVTGSIDISKLSEIEPKTDEARAQLEQLKQENQLGQDAANAAAARLSEQAAAQNPNLVNAPQDNRDAQGKAVAADQPDAPQTEDVAQLQADAEAAGVTVDKRWGADRLRQETEQAKASSSRKQR